VAGGPKSAQELIDELRGLVVDYARQETVDPLKSLGRYVAFGLAGSILLATGGVFVSLGLLRLLQTQTGGVFDGGWSFVPYLIVLVFVVIAIGLLVGAVLRTKQSEMERP
jgi:hypothetical protein